MLFYIEESVGIDRINKLPLSLLGKVTYMGGYVLILLGIRSIICSRNYIAFEIKNMGD